MTRKVGHLLLATLAGMVIGSVAQSQSPQSFREKYKKEFPPIPVGPFKAPDPFIGKWEIDKEKSNTRSPVRIDGAVALCMALDLARRQPQPIRKREFQVLFV